ncbi:hypothetical protein HRG_014824 [Hirsutella rhossiliensis]
MKTDIATGALTVTLKAPCSGKSSTEIASFTRLSIRTVISIYARPVERGFEPNELPLTVRDEWPQNASRSGRPSKQALIQDESIVKVRRDQYGRGGNCADIATELGITAHLISGYRWKGERWYERGIEL